jgi:hypothetical protein
LCRRQLPPQQSARASRLFCGMRSLAAASLWGRPQRGAASLACSRPEQRNTRTDGRPGRAAWRPRGSRRCMSLLITRSPDAPLSRTQIQRCPTHARTKRPGVPASFASIRWRHRLPFRRTAERTRDRVFAPNVCLRCVPKFAQSLYQRGFAPHSCVVPADFRRRAAAGTPLDVPFLRGDTLPASFVVGASCGRHLFSLFLGACGMPCGRDPWRSWWRSHKSTRNPRRVAQSLYSCEMSGSSSVKRRRRRRNGATASRATERAAAPAVDFVRTR